MPLPDSYLQDVENRLSQASATLADVLKHALASAPELTDEVVEKFKMEMLPFDQDILDEFRTVTLPYWVKQLMIAHEDNYFPMNPSNCVHGHFKCQFSDAYNGGICSVSRSVRAQKLSRYFVVGPEWDPADIKD